MSDDERRAFSNLILLCHPHHTIVDVLQVKKFGAAKLIQWKTEREANHQDALSRLGEVTPEVLQQLIAEAVKDRDDKIMNALNRLEASDSEAAELLRSVINELSELRELRESSYMDPGVTEDFTNAAHNLYEVFRSGALEEFSSAAHNLRRLPEY